MTHEELYDTLSEIVNTTAKSHVVARVSKNKELLEELQPYYGETLPQKIRTILYGEEHICKHGNVRNFVTLPEGYVNCGRAKVCKCCAESASLKIKEREANMTAEQKAERSKKIAETVKSKKDGTYVEITDESPEFIDAVVVSLFVKDNIKHYPSLIKSRPRMYQWVMDNSLIQTDHFPSMVYSAVHQMTNICQLGNEKPFSNWNDGFIGCGIARECECTSKNIGKNGSIALRRRTPEQIAFSNTKREKTMIEKYGHAFNAQRPEVKASLTTSRLDPTISVKLNDIEWMKTEYLVNQRSSVDIAAELGIDYSTVLEYCRKHGFEIRARSSYSRHELDIIEFISSLGIDAMQSNRTVLDNKEIDVYVDEYKFGIELNGLYWHSYNPAAFPHEDAFGKFKVKHLAKTLEANDAGVELMHITDWEWMNKTDIVKSMIRSKLNVTDRIFARKCKLVTLNTKEAREFFDTNHLQGYIASTYYIGLEYNDELVMAISAGHSRFDNNNAIELHRLAAKLNTTVIGGGSKLLKELKRLSDNAMIVSYCDRSKSAGQGYLAMGFKFERVTNPGYFWTEGNVVISRHKCNHKNLQKWLNGYDSSLTEFENMYNAKYRCYWDCGNFVFVL